MPDLLYVLFSLILEVRIPAHRYRTEWLAGLPRSANSN